MALVVTGLSHHGDIAALNTALAAAGLSAEPLQVIGPDDQGSLRITSGLAGSEFTRTDLGTGTGVPGINNSRKISTSINDSNDGRLSDLPIPDSEAGNYYEALERGRSVIAYYARPESVDAVEAAFRASGLLNVRRF
jgi:hypothetical protein